MRELRDLAAGRADLLAEATGIFEGASAGRHDEPLARQAALCKLAGADDALISQWAAEGRRRAQAARQPPHGGRPPNRMRRTSTAATAARNE